jgi:hypothetical protein
MDVKRNLAVIWVRAVQPLRLLRQLIGYLGVRAEIALAQVRGETVATVVDHLTSAGYAGRVVSRDPNGAELSVSLCPATQTMPVALRAEPDMS